MYNFVESKGDARWKASCFSCSGILRVFYMVPLFRASKAHLRNILKRDMSFPILLKKDVYVTQDFSWSRTTLSQFLLYKTRRQWRNLYIGGDDCYPGCQPPNMIMMQQGFGMCGRLYYRDIKLASNAKKVEERTIWFMFNTRSLLSRRYPYEMYTIVLAHATPTPTYVVAERSNQKGPIENNKTDRKAQLSWLAKTF